MRLGPLRQILAGLWAHQKLGTLRVPTDPPCDKSTRTHKQDNSAFLTFQDSAQLAALGELEYLHPRVHTKKQNGAISRPISGQGWYVWLDRWLRLENRDQRSTGGAYMTLGPR